MKLGTMTVRLFLCLGIAWLSASPGRADEKKPTVIEGWGKVVDPDGDCPVKADKGKLTLSVPGTLHDLNARNDKLALRVLVWVNLTASAVCR